MHGIKNCENCRDGSCCWMSLNVIVTFCIFSSSVFHWLKHKTTNLLLFFPNVVIKSLRKKHSLQNILDRFVCINYRWKYQTFKVQNRTRRLLLSLYGQRRMELSFKYFLLCSTEGRKSERFETTWRWVKEDHFHFWMDYKSPETWNEKILFSEKICEPDNWLSTGHFRKCPFNKSL